MTAASGSTNARWRSRAVVLRMGGLDARPGSDATDSAFKAHSPKTPSA